MGIGLIWRVNGTNHASYVFDSNVSSPVNVNAPLLGVEVMIISASQSQNSPTTIDIVSTLSSNVSILRGSMIQCRSTPYFSEVLDVTGIGGNYVYFVVHSYKTMCP